MDDTRVQWLCARVCAALHVEAAAFEPLADDVTFVLDSAGPQGLLFCAEQKTEVVEVPITPPVTTSGAYAWFLEQGLFLTVGLAVYCFP